MIIDALFDQDGHSGSPTFGLFLIEAFFEGRPQGG
jgi:hypothetical protein